MNERTLRILEYPKIIESLTALAGSELGKAKCRDLLPDTDLSLIQKMQTETADALRRLYAKGSLSFYGLKDLSPSLLRLKVGSPLNMPELLSLAQTLDTALRVRSYGVREIRQDTESTEENASESTGDLLDPMFSAIEPLSQLSREIRRCIISEEEIADDASPGLRHVRREMRLTSERIRSQLNSMVNSQTIGSMLQDNLITMRGGRYCLPVKAEYRSQVQGMIHDQSSSGSTLFIEPMAIVKLNNDLRTLEVQEKAEMEKVLEDLSAQAAGHIDEIASDVSLLAELDFIFARAALARSYQGSEPILGTDGIIHLKKARHPLLDRKKVVPIDVTLGEDFRLLLVTGPNTGGKTVSLKTVGLLTLMAQSGLHIPAFDGSRLSVFDQIFADIGDEQSIEQSLSTFSSHMTNLIRIQKEADDRTLVLLDELCAGTDPTEGAALAMAILQDLLDRGATTMATTHYAELKLFALSTPNAANACCEFDVDTLSPTYRLLIGVPGKSNAFAISAKLGLPSYLIDDARSRMDSADQSFEDVLNDLESGRKQLERDQEEARQNKEEIARLREALEARQDKIAEQKEKILNKAREEARDIVQEAKDFADQTIREMNRLGQTGNAKAMEQQRTAAREKVDKLNSSLSVKPAAQAKAQSKREIRQGDSVFVNSMGIKGIVISKPDAKGQVMVQMGILKSRVNLSDLALIAEETIQTPTLSRTGAGEIKMSKSAAISPSLNVVGKTVDEALAEVEKYLDDAYLAHLKTVTIIHGRGTFALRNAIQKRLKKLPHIASYRPGEYNEGGVGVTVVEFK